MATTIRAKVDGELTKRVGKWFTVREIQDKLCINPSTLKPLIMKYARESVLRRRHVKGTARSVEFSPAAANVNSFKAMLERFMPYRNLGAKTSRTPMKGATKAGKSSSRKATSRKRR